MHALAGRDARLLFKEESMVDTMVHHLLGFARCYDIYL
jgi:hypothetical protein